MTGDAVFLAWGAPSRVYEGSDKGVQTARWDYAKLQPVCTTGFYGGFGWGGGYRGWRGGYPYGRCGYGSYYMVSPQVDYVPYRSATVQFRRGRVESWERTR